MSRAEDRKPFRSSHQWLHPCGAGLGESGLEEDITAFARASRALTRFPHTCRKAGRLSTHTQWSLPLAEVLRAEGIQGAGRFAGGLGRGGDFETI